MPSRKINFGEGCHARDCAVDEDSPRVCRSRGNGVAGVAGVALRASIRAHPRHHRSGGSHGSLLQLFHHPQQYRGGAGGGSCDHGSPGIFRQRTHARSGHVVHRRHRLRVLAGVAPPVATTRCAVVGRQWPALRNAAVVRLMVVVVRAAWACGLERLALVAAVSCRVPGLGLAVWRMGARIPLPIHRRGPVGRDDGDAQCIAGVRVVPAGGCRAGGHRPHVGSQTTPSMFKPAAAASTVPPLRPGCAPWRCR